MMITTRLSVACSKSCQGHKCKCCLATLGFFFLWCHYCASKAEEQTNTVRKYRHLHECDKLSHYPCLSGHTFSPRLRTDCPLWFELSMQPWYMLWLCGVFHHMHTHRQKKRTHASWKDQPVERESCPTAGSLPDEEGLPSHLPLHWPALQPDQRQWGCPFKKKKKKKALDLLYHPLFTNNILRLSNQNKAVPPCGQLFCLSWYEKKKRKKKNCQSRWWNYKPHSEVLNKSVLS